MNGFKISQKKIINQHQIASNLFQSVEPDTWKSKFLVCDALLYSCRLHLYAALHVVELSKFQFILIDLIFKRKIIITKTKHLPLLSMWFPIRWKKKHNLIEIIINLISVRLFITYFAYIFSSSSFNLKNILPESKSSFKNWCAVRVHRLTKMAVYEFCVWSMHNYCLWAIFHISTICTFDQAI